MGLDAGLRKSLLFNHHFTLARCEDGAKSRTAAEAGGPLRERGGIGAAVPGRGGIAQHWMWDTRNGLAGCRLHVAFCFESQCKAVCTMYL